MTENEKIMIAGCAAGGTTAGESTTHKITDLLGREQISPDLTKVFDLLRGHTVFVSGGGGSIGSELVRQVAASGVAKTIIIFDIAENNTCYSDWKRSVVR